LNMLAGGQVDGSWLGIQRQNDNMHFLQRFALRPHGDYDQTAAMKFVLEHQNPFVTGAVISEKGSGVYPETNYSLLTVNNPNVLLWAVKAHDDGIDKGLVARLWNLTDATAQAEIAAAPGISGAHRATHIETDLETISLTDDGKVSATFTRQQMQTYRLNLK
ncbi:MAG: glycoside hydrolase, partial [Verrucomicrobiota bacterium]